ncbi:MAG: hypothetical protein QOJ35_581 [Solirubrobacteraceae bacterium]|nr:hypothetical protein [Solirubrobacteraceae bacterium]
MEPAAVDASIVACQDFSADAERSSPKRASFSQAVATTRVEWTALLVAVIEKRERKRRDGKAYSVYRARWYEADGRERSRTFDSRADAKAFEARCVRR